MLLADVFIGHQWEDRVKRLKTPFLFEKRAYWQWVYHYSLEHGHYWFFTRARARLNQTLF